LVPICTFVLLKYTPSLTYREWNRIYGALTRSSSGLPTADHSKGELVYLEVLGEKLLVIGSGKTVKELLERRSTIYSDRPREVMASELCVIFYMTNVRVRVLNKKQPGWV
jgi:hypothetical protein